ncbi:hypothetical protein NE237_010833 [Protea cynaroides]|uniref:Late embryogenesis abundant protein LEA-2 subgroup domain-containing protein n=1 Tax=Protea cynaroides TaxID=273540 RepID=A0A9Q0R1M8_9MAGN|nr:hypothetical protein NE237_010833 [Protea cynaroides]
MGDPATLKATNHGSSPKSIQPILTKPPGGHDCRFPKRPKKTLSVSFSELPPTLHKYKKQQQRNPRSFSCSCNSCCFCFQYSCLVFLCISFLIVLFAALFLTYINITLPEIKIERLTMPKLNISSVALQSYLSADVDLFVSTFNDNKRVQIFYDPIEVSVSSGNIELGRATIPGFLQNTNNLTVLKVHTRVSNYLVDNEDAGILKTKFNDKSLVLDVLFDGDMGLNYRSLKLKGLPIVIRCSNITLSRIAVGIESKCDINVFTLWDTI